jgi:thioredoxin
MLNEKSATGFFKNYGWLATVLWIALVLGCNPIDSSRNAASASSVITEINSLDHFNRVVESAGDRLLVFDLYADWCQPCKQLEPVLDSVARETIDESDFYRVDMDSHQSVAQIFKVQGIPYVAFVKDGTIVFSLMGLHPKTEYLKAIKSLTRKAADSL